VQLCTTIEIMFGSDTTALYYIGMRNKKNNKGWIVVRFGKIF
jgi:hypothetical protein